jgi:hypothetical protein
MFVELRSMLFHLYFRRFRCLVLNVECPASTRDMTVFKIWEMLFLQAIVDLDLIISLRIYIVEFFSMMGVYMIASVMF